MMMKWLMEELRVMGVIREVVVGVEGSLEGSELSGKMMFVVGCLLGVCTRVVVGGVVVGVVGVDVVADGVVVVVGVVVGVVGGGVVVVGGDNNDTGAGIVCMGGFD